MKNLISRPRICQSGVAAVEFALVAAVFFTLLIGIMEMGRMLFYWNTAAELTRRGARIAVVCDPSAATATVIKQKLADFYPLIPADKVNISYSPAGCNVNTCLDVTVRVNTGLIVSNYIPFVPDVVNSLELPGFSTTLPREILQSTVGGEANPECS